MIRSAAESSSSRTNAIVLRKAGDHNSKKRPSPFQQTTLHRNASCSCGGSCPKCKTENNAFEVSQPTDAAEIEADQIADTVINTAADKITRPKHYISLSPEKLSAKCSACEKLGEEEDEEVPLLQRKEFGNIVSDPPPDDDDSSINRVLNSAGHRLAPETREFFEPRLGYKLDGVRIHTGSAAAQSARAVNAKAYTSGSDIVFGTGEYQPESCNGKKLLAHELAHVVQSAKSSSKIHRNTLHRQPLDSAKQELGLIDVQIMQLQHELILPIDPLRSMKLMKLYKLQQRRSALAGQTTPVKRSQSSLNEEAVRLATKQAARREFWNAIEDIPSWMIEDMIDSEKFKIVMNYLDLYWDEKEKELIRKPIVYAIEHDVLFNDEAKRIYDRTLWDLLENKPVKKSLFKRAMDVICENTNPCHDNMEQFHADLESGMDVDDARMRGLVRIGINFIPSKGPRGPIALGPGSPGGGMSFKPPGGFGEPVPAIAGRGTGTAIIREAVPTVPIHPFPIPIPGTKTKTDTKTDPKPDTTTIPDTVKKPTPVVPPTAGQKVKPPTTVKTEPGTDPKIKTGTSRMPAPVPKTVTKQPPKKKEKKCKDICPTPLPIQWPAVMPLPRGARPLVRTPSNDEYISPDRRSKPQRDLQQEIREQLDLHRSGRPGAVVPRPCFAQDTDPNDLYDAHHIHPLFLGGAEDDTNLCALRRDKHEQAHPKLNNQNNMLYTNAIWINCKVCSGMLPDHLGQQEYDVD